MIELDDDDPEKDNYDKTHWISKNEKGYYAILFILAIMAVFIMLLVKYLSN